jgi:hypothetical protein
VDVGSRGDSRRTVFMIVAAIIAASVISAPLASAVTTVVARIKSTSGAKIRASGGAVHTKQQGAVTAKLRDSGSGAVEASSVNFAGSVFPPSIANSTGAIDVKTYAGGGALFGAGNCTATPADGPNVVIVPANTHITGIIMTQGTTGGSGQVNVQSDLAALAGLRLLRLRVSDASPNAFVGLGNGITITDDLTFTGHAEDDELLDGDCRFVIVGQKAS